MTRYIFKPELGKIHNLHIELIQTHKGDQRNLANSTRNVIQDVKWAHMSLLHGISNGQYFRPCDKTNDSKMSLYHDLAISICPD